MRYPGIRGHAGSNSSSVRHSGPRGFTCDLQFAASAADVTLAGALSVARLRASLCSASSQPPACIRSHAHNRACTWILQAQDSSECVRCDMRSLMHAGCAAAALRGNASGSSGRDALTALKLGIQGFTTPAWLTRCAHGLEGCTNRAGAGRRAGVGREAGIGHASCSRAAQLAGRAGLRLAA